MTIIVHSDVVMPNSVLAAGVRGKQIRKNTRAQSPSGHMQINVVMSKTLRQYELGIVPMLPDAWQAIEGLHEVTDGGAYGFLMEDPKDNSAPAGVMAWVSPGVYQLVKRYTSIGSTRTKDRNITRPRATPALTRNASAVTLGTAAGNAAVDYTTGRVTFVADASQAIASITVGATTVLNFADGTGIVAALGVGESVYLSSITGTAAATLNNLNHIITAKGATSLTIGTVTTGLTATGGTAYKYPQPSETLAWSGRFYVPVHFANDDIDWELVRSGPTDSRLLAGPSVVLNEVRE